jgi:hypothetical protein
MQKLFDDKIDSFKPDIKEELLNKINTNGTNIDAHDERLNKLEALDFGNFGKQYRSYQ